MKNKKFAPILAPNIQPDLSDLNYPLLGSYKLDGCRCLIKNGEILTRSLKPVPNKQLKELLEPLRKYTEQENIILDGEIYSPDLSFQEIISYTMTEDFEDPKTVKKFGKVLTIPDSLKFYCFDYLDEGMLLDIYFDARSIIAKRICQEFTEIAEYVPQLIIDNESDVDNYMKQSLDSGCEGLILRDPKGKYKFGRGTLKEGIIYKIKPFETFDSKIIGVEQSTIVDPKAEKKTNELGYSETSRKKGDRILIEKASAFVVEYNGHKVKPTLKMTDQEKQEVWKNRDKYLGKTIEFKGMMIGSKDRPRHPIFLRMRPDKDK